jgi:hypothetical protein
VHGSPRRLGDFVDTKAPKGYDELSVPSVIPCWKKTSGVKMRPFGEQKEKDLSASPSCHRREAGSFANHPLPSPPRGRDATHKQQNRMLVMKGWFPGRNPTLPSILDCRNLGDHVSPRALCPECRMTAFVLGRWCDRLRLARLARRLCLSCPHTLSTPWQSFFCHCSAG